MMNIFGLVLSKIYPLYFLILLGYIAGRVLKVKRESIAPLLIYLISPLVVFSAILGMMMIGLGVSTLNSFKVNVRFCVLSFCFKFLIGPAIIYSLILLDRSFFHFFSEQIHAIAMLMAIVPLPANAVAVATELKTEPETVGVAVLLSTLFGLIYIPVVVSMLGLSNLS